MKKRYLTLYDYGQGGLWGYVVAPSKETIISRFPELEVVDEEPAWMTDETRADLERRTEDIDRPGDGILGIMLKGRSASNPAS